ncbi:MAG TPA: hypothetical protein ENJ37_01740 [Deltaproteobacteria bacterium]|nr:hypothetical protein [Deltaproteobacteria bacterium]
MSKGGAAGRSPGAGGRPRQARVGAGAARAAAAALAAALLVSAVLSGWDGVLAASRELVRKEKKLEDLKRKLREEKKNLSSIEKREVSVLGELERLGKLLARLRREHRGLSASLRRVKGEIKKKDRRIGSLEKKRSELGQRLERRLRAMYLMRNGSSLRVIASASGADELGRRLLHLARIMEADTRLVEECERLLAELRRERRSLAALKSKRLAAIRDIKKKQRQIMAARRSKTALLRSVEREKARHLAVVSELESAARELTALVTKLRRRRGGFDSTSGFAAMKGRLAMPVKGKVVSLYGKVTHPEFKTVTFNNGIIIEAPLGEPVRSVYDGEVVYVGWLRGYGQVMIVDHDGGFYTLFAYLSRVVKERGERVKAGEVIARVGDSGPHDAPALYFEIRQRGVPRDPLGWIASR